MDDAEGCKDGSNFDISLRESNREEDVVNTSKCYLTGWYKRLPERTYSKRQEAAKNRVKDLKELESTLLETITAPGFNPYKRAELVNNFKKSVPEFCPKTGIRLHDDELYVDLTPEEKSKVKMEAKMNHEKKVEVRNMKKRKLGEELEAAAK